MPRPRAGQRPRWPVILVGVSRRSLPNGTHCPPHVSGRTPHVSRGVHTRSRSPHTHEKPLQRSPTRQHPLPHIGPAHCASRAHEAPSSPFGDPQNAIVHHGCPSRHRHALHSTIQVSVPAYVRPSNSHGASIASMVASAGLASAPSRPGCVHPTSTITTTTLRMRRVCRRLPASTRHLLSNLAALRASRRAVSRRACRATSRAARARCRASRARSRASPGVAGPSGARRDRRSGRAA